MNEEAVGEDEDEYDDNNRAGIQKMELALLLEKIRADLGGQEGAVAEDEELVSLMKEVGALLAEQEEGVAEDDEELYGYDDDEYAAIIEMEMAALRDTASEHKRLKYEFEIPYQQTAKNENISDPEFGKTRSSVGLKNVDGDDSELETRSSVGLRNTDYRNVKHSLGTKPNDIYTDKHGNINKEIDTNGTGDLPPWGGSLGGG